MAKSSKKNLEAEGWRDRRKSQLPSGTLRAPRFALPAPRFTILALVASLCLLIIGGVGWLVLYPQMDATNHWRQAQQAIDHGDFALAQAHLQRCLEVWPQSGETQFLMARTCRRSGDFAEARAHLQVARRLGWVKELIDLEFLLVRAQSGVVRPVEQTLRGYLTSGHSDAGLIVEALVIGWLESNFVDDAYRLTTLWLEEHPDDWQVRFWHGRVLEAGLRYDLAAEEYQRVLVQEPNYAQAHLRRAEMLLQKGRYAEALPHFESYLEHDPQDVAAHFGLARCQRILSPPAVTQATLVRLFEVCPAHAGGCLLRGQMALDGDDPKEALAWLRRAEKLGPPDMETCQTLATTLRRLERMPEAQAYERQGQQIKKDLQRMEELIKKIIAQPQEATFRYEAGTSLICLGRREEGARWLATVLLLDPNHQPAKKALADCLQALGDPKLAAYYQRVVENGN